MAERRVPVRLVLTDNFSGPMLAAKEAGETLARELARAQATWEPHDWGDF